MRKLAWIALLLAACQGQELPTSPSAQLSPKLSMAPYVERVAPGIGDPHGGERVVIEGHQFDAPLRVFFETGGHALEAYVVSFTQTRIEAITPPLAFRAQQRVFANVRVVVRAGMQYESAYTAERAFAYQPQLLTPSILAVTPNRARLGETVRLTAFGEGFQQPVFALLVQGERTIEARILRAEYDRVEFETMPGLHAGPADLLLRNFVTGREAVLRNAITFSGKPEAGARQ